MSRVAWGVAAALVALVGLAAPVHADDALARLSKKDRERALKGAKHRPPPAPGTRPAKLLNLYNSWTHEWLAVEAQRPAQEARPAQATIDRFLRDHFTNQPSRMEPRLIELIREAAQHFRSDTAIVVSAFRHPKYNLILRKKGHQVARDSAHTHGNAVDFYIPRTPTKVLHAWAKAQGVGGVGLYLGSGFIHMDTGKVRYWEGE